MTQDEENAMRDDLLARIVTPPAYCPMSPPCDGDYVLQDYVTIPNDAIQRELAARVLGIHGMDGLVLTDELLAAIAAGRCIAVSIGSEYTFFLSRKTQHT